MSRVKLPDGEVLFIPHKECMDASGGCFIEGRCHYNCRARAKAERGGSAVSTLRTIAALLHLDGDASEYQIVSTLRELLARGIKLEGGR